jgi:diadenosine tetraphosphatase ApaH/serine/threonine PP2A family protein phosphatase
MVALLYDVHGNRPALETVLADAEAAGAERFVLGGDYGLFGAWPAETVARLDELGATWIRGNVDRWCAGGGDPPPDDPQILGCIERCRELLEPTVVARLGELPEQVVIDGVRYCHASPRSDMDGFAPEAAGNDRDLLAGSEERRVVFGHTHIQFERAAAGGTHLVNPGSVGMPLDGDTRAAYALVDDDGEVELRRVAYDHQAYAAEVRERLGEYGEVPAQRVEQARFDV